MTQPYSIDRGSNWRRQVVRDWLVGLDPLPEALQERIVTAWVSSWASSTHERLEDMPFSPGSGFYPLMRHVNEVTRAGIDRATAHSVLRLIASPEPERMKICGNCGWLFLDRSKNRSRTWCDMAVCGNRAKASKHYRRRKEENGS